MTAHVFVPMYVVNGTSMGHRHDYTFVQKYTFHPPYTYLRVSTRTRSYLVHACVHTAHARLESVCYMYTRICTQRCTIRVTHGWHVPTITMDTTICTLSYRKIKVVGSQAFARFQVPSSLAVRYTFEPFVSRGRRFLDQCRVCTYTHTRQRKSVISLVF